jgi:hypothetical protein
MGSKVDVIKTVKSDSSIADLNGVSSAPENKLFAKIYSLPE